jgi:glycosyl transferase family 25
MASQSPLLNFFDKSYIINLPERSDRCEQMKQELRMLGLSEPSERVVFFPAIKPTDRGEFPSIGARGCFLSHLDVLKEAKRQNLNHLLIMEDDLSFTGFLMKQQEIVVNELQRLNWDFAYLGHGLSLPFNSKGIFQAYSEPLRLTHFLAINKKTIAQLVDFLEEILRRPSGHPEGGPMHVDGAYSTFRQRNPQVVTLIANPSLGFQRSSPSNVDGYKWFDKIPVFSHLFGKVRHIKNWQRRRSVLPR